LHEFQKLYPDFKLEDKLVQQEGRDVMVGLQYHRHGKQRRSTVGNWGKTPGMPA
jgi:hypothetical protein